MGTRELLDAEGEKEASYDWTRIMAEQEVLKREVTARYLRRDRTMIPDLGPDLDVLIEEGRLGEHEEETLEDDRGRWAKVRGALMEMCRSELHDITKEAGLLDGDTPLTDGIGRLVPHLLYKKNPWWFPFHW